MDATKQPVVPKFKDFEAMVLFFNGLYKLPIAPFPSLISESEWQHNRFGFDPASMEVPEAIARRFDDFFRVILGNEVSEYKDINLTNDPIDILTELADLLGDIIVYCASEMARYGIPMKEVLRIIMDSNFSKLDANGNPIYDETGKVDKGPYYWKPEPQIKALLISLQPGASDGPSEIKESSS